MINFAGSGLRPLPFSYFGCRLSPVREMEE